jgi:hypothetical protein
MPDEPTVSDRTTDEPPAESAGDHAFDNISPRRPSYTLHLVNPNPKLSLLTWFILAVLVAGGSFVYYRLFFLPFSSIDTGVVEVNGVELPVEIEGFRLVRGKLSLGGSYNRRADAPPEPGTIERIVYGSPDSISGGVGWGLLLYAKPATESPDIERYLISVIESLGAGEVVLEDVTPGKPYSAIGVFREGAAFGSDDGAANRTIEPTADTNAASQNAQSSVVVVACAMPIDGTTFLLARFADEKNAERAKAALASALDEMANR